MDPATTMALRRRPNVVTLSCTAKAHVPKLARRGGCDVRAAISGARKVAGGVPPSELCSTQALQRRDEAGPCQLQRGVRRRRDAGRSPWDSKDSHSQGMLSGDSGSSCVYRKKYTSGSGVAWS